jgi:hypothetical protein
MDQLAFQMKSAMQSGAQEQQEEDMDALRQLLENIVQLSFDEEALMDEPWAPRAPRTHDSWSTVARSANSAMTRK